MNPSMKFKNTPSPPPPSFRSSTSRGFDQMTPLAPGYTPGDDDVLVGRGKKCLAHTGNLRFKQIVATKLGAYLAAECRVDKTAILMDVIAQVRTNSLCGGFIKQNPSTGQYFEVGDFLAKEKTAQAFRDALHEYYSSSNPSKKKRRIQSTVSTDSNKKCASSTANLIEDSSNNEDGEGEQSLVSTIYSQYGRRRSKSAPSSPIREYFPSLARSATPPPSFSRMVTLPDARQSMPSFPGDVDSPAKRKSSVIIRGETLAMLSAALTDTHYSGHESVCEDPFEPIPLSSNVFDDMGFPVHRV